MGEPRYPFGVHTIDDIFPAFCSMWAPGKRTVQGVALPYDGNRLVAAWWVLTGRAYALIWPEPGELEQAIERAPAPSHGREG